MLNIIIELNIPSDLPSALLAKVNGKTKYFSEIFYDRYTSDGKKDDLCIYMIRGEE